MLCSLEIFNQEMNKEIQLFWEFSLINLTARLHRYFRIIFEKKDKSWSIKTKIFFIYLIIFHQFHVSCCNFTKILNVLNSTIVPILDALALKGLGRPVYKLDRDNTWHYSKIKYPKHILGNNIALYHIWNNFY